MHYIHRLFSCTVNKCTLKMKFFSESTQSIERYYASSIECYSDRIMDKTNVDKDKS